VDDHSKPAIDLFNTSYYSANFHQEVKYPSSENRESIDNA